MWKKCDQPEKHKVRALCPTPIPMTKHGTQPNHTDGHTNRGEF